MEVHYSLNTGENVVKLIVDARESSDSVIPLRWCVTKDTLAKLEERGATNPHMLISIANTKKEVRRYCVPLERAMVYVELNHAGLNRIRSVIVYPNPSYKPGFRFSSIRGKTVPQGSSLWEEEYNDTDYSYTATEFNPTRLFHVDSNLKTMRHEIGSVDINVDPKFFAHEPPEWEKKWVNLWFESNPIDQCQYRKRRFLAYTLQPILMLVFLTWTTSVRGLYAFISLLIGVRAINFSAILHPIRDDIRDIGSARHEEAGLLWGKEYWHESRDFFGTDKTGKKRPFWFALLRPITWLVITTLIYSLQFLPYKLMMDIAEYISFLSRNIAALVIVAVAAILILMFADWLTKFASSKMESRPKDKDNFWTNYSPLLDDIRCDTGLTADIRTLKRPAIALRFSEIKAKVCKPYIAR